MNTGGQTYRNPTRMQLLNERHHRDELNQRLKGALERINMIEMAATSKINEDPMESIDDLKTRTDKLFSNIPQDFLKGQKNGPKSDAAAQVTSRVKDEMKNPDYDEAVAGRTKRDKKNPHEAIVTSKKPLRLTWDAERALNGGQHPSHAENKAQSQLAGIFQGTTALEPAEDSRKNQVKSKLDERRSKFIPQDKGRKAKLLEPKPRPQSAKVNADFVPGCAAFDSAAGEARRREVEAQRSSALASRAGGRPFKN